MVDLQGSIEAVRIALDERDNYTCGHCGRVVMLVSALGRACGIGGDELRTLEIGAAFHDVGKIGIRDDVLLKPARLDGEEWEHMKSHTVRSERILRSARLECTDVVAPMVRHHHEALDGNGYPDGLKGDAIPLGSRIITVVDGYDAMTTARSYQQTRDHADAMDILAGESGNKLDPEIFRVFERVIERHPLRAH